MTEHVKSAIYRRMPDLLKAPLLRAYLARVRDWHGYIRFLGLPDRRDNPDIVIDRLFIEPLLTRRHMSADEDPGQWIDQAETATEALSVGNPLVVLGDPGTGKSTLVNYLVWMLARPGRNPLVDALGWQLPVPMVLRELRLRGVSDFDGLKEAFLDHAMSEPLRNDDFLDRTFESGEAFVVLDGIDEIGDPGAREALRDAVFEGFERYPGCRWVVTSRIVGYSEVSFSDTSHGTQRGADVKRTDHDRTAITRYIAPFDDRRISAFARRWYVQREAATGRAEEQAGDFIRAIHEDRAILRLARIPNLLIMMALIHRIEATLPHGRALLYDRISEAYLESIDKFRGIYSGAVDLPRKKLWLARIGLEMQRRRSNDQKDQESEILVDAADVKHWLKCEIERSGPSSGVSSPAAFLDYVGRRSGLFLPRGHDRYAFIHLSFQEYFAAVAIEREVTSMGWALNKVTVLGVDTRTVARWARDSVWRETFAFLFERLSDKNDWHDELQKRVFGDGLSELKAVRDGGLNLGVLLARLVINPQSGLSYDARRSGLRACMRAALGQMSMGSVVDQVHGIISTLLSQDSEQNDRVMGVLANEARSLSITEIDLRGTQVSDIKPLAEVVSLKSLDLMDTDVADISAIKGFVALETLRLDDTTVSDVSLVSSLTSLERLELASTRVTNLDGLGGLRTLRMLDLSNTEVSDLAPLKDLCSLEWIGMMNTKVRDLAPLSTLSLLTYVNLSYTSTVEVAPLGRLPRLQELRLRHTKVTDASPLAGVQTLSTLDLMGTEVSDIDPLSELGQLDDLDLARTGVADISALSRLKALRRLVLLGTKVVDVSPIAELGALEWLDLMDTGVEDIGPLGQLGGVERLDLMNTRVSDISALLHMTSLEWLDLSGTGVGDITVLSRIPTLRFVFVSDTIPEDMIRRVGEALPDCRISSRRGGTYDVGPPLAGRGENRQRWFGQ